MVSKKVSIYSIFLFGLLTITQSRADDFVFNPTNGTARVVIIENSNAISDFAPNDSVVQQMVNRGVADLTGKTNVSAAWRSLISSNDVVGIKVFSGGGEISGTRPATVAAIIRALLDAGISTNRIIIWDKRQDDLRSAGFVALGRQL